MNCIKEEDVKMNEASGISVGRNPIERRRLRRTQSFDRIGVATTPALGIFVFSARATPQLDSVEVTPWLLIASGVSLEIAH